MGCRNKSPSKGNARGSGNQGTGAVASEDAKTLSTFLSSVEGHVVSSIRDTGATHVIVDATLVPADAPTRPSVSLTTINSQSVDCPQVLVSVSTPYYKGKLWALAMKDAFMPMIVGNNLTMEDGTTCSVSEDQPKGVAAAVTTRSMLTKKKVLKPVLIPFPDGPALEVEPRDLQRMQENDVTLETVRSRVGIPATNRSLASYVMKDGLLYRRFDGNTQLVVPKDLRESVLKMGHDMPLAGHLGVRRTRERIWQAFYWPGISSDVRKYCQSCDPCQKTVPKGRNTRIPLGAVPIVSEPFAKVGVDLIGPIIPRSQDGNKYVLVVVDYATKYPEAVPLKTIDAETVAEALWQIWTRVGVPKEIISDLGTQFISELMREMHSLLGTKGRTTTPYHAQANGLVERFNATLKQMIKRLCLDHPRDWDRYIPAVLFAYREVPQESMRFSPFELLYGRTVRGPMAILKDHWTKREEKPEEPRPEIKYVLNLREKLADTCEIAQQHLKRAKEKYAKHFDRKAKERWFDPGDEVLLLLPVKKNKLQLAWRGPYKIVERTSDWDYKIRVGSKVKLYHANLLRRYHRRDAPAAAVGCCAVQNQEREQPDVVEHAVGAAGLAPVVVHEEELPNVSADIPVIHLVAEETWKDVKLGDKLTSAQRNEVLKLCEQYADILTDLPLRCKLGQCELQLEDKTPVRVRQYPLPHSQEETIKKEVQSMLDLGVIERASSAYSAPIVLVKKKDGKIRFCIDYRRLNRVIVFDGEPMPDTEQIFAKIGQARYFTKLDLTKGYWQIPMKEEDKPLTAFTTPQGQFQWITMPFGLKTAGAVFSRVMRKLLDGVQDPDLQNFIDDMLVASRTWEQHMQTLRKLFEKLREYQLAARPTKCQIGMEEVLFLGFKVRQGKLLLDDDKVEKIKKAPTPSTKKELRSFLGLAGYYRKFVPNYATIALPLTDKTKAKQPERIKWDTDCQKAFDQLKDALTSEPILRLVNKELPYTLRTDASGVGLGAVLLQDQGDGLYPVAYASKKLHGAELHYHTIELECLAIVWAIRKFYPYLYGRHFILESDHHPLRYLDRIRPVSKRLMGWALELQSHSFSFKAIKGADNVGADYLSRAH